MRSNSVGVRALKVSVLVSTAFIALSASALVLLEGRRATRSVEIEVAQLLDTQAPAIVEALWDYDDELLRALVEGLRMYPYINHVKVESSEAPQAESGSRKAGSAELSVPLRRRARGGEEIPLGALTVQIDRGRLRAELLRTILPSMAILLASIAAISIVFLFLFSRAATRHLTTIARYLETFDPNAAPAPLELDKRRRGDEFDMLADAFNAMSANLRSARDAERGAMDGLLRSLSEKEILLQEIYHRTRNNMQLISALLSMEAGPEPDLGLGSLVARMDRRIASMALVHKKLYESKDLSRIDLGSYLEELAREIERSSLASKPELRIVVRADEGVVALIDTAVPCGLAVNELVVNSIEHAFPGNRGGKIVISLARREPGLLGLEVSDDGVGFPEGFELSRDRKLGLRIVALLVESQLKGRLERLSGPGARMALEIREDLFESRV